MRIFNKDKTEELATYDEEKGYLSNDKLFIAHHEATQAVEEQGHYETIAEYPNGGKDVEWVVDIPEVEEREAYDEYEDILVFIPYTEEELENLREEKYRMLIEAYIRKKYSINDEFGILRQRDTKPEEFEAYNTYVEECKKKAKAVKQQGFGDWEDDIV